VNDTYFNIEVYVQFIIYIYQKFSLKNRSIPSNLSRAGVVLKYIKTSC